MRKIIFILAIGAGILVIGSIIWFSWAGPVLVEWHYGIKYGAICDPPFVVFNPMRDRAAERTADDFLLNLQNGNVKILDDVISGHERLEHIRLSETELKILSFSSGGRKEAPNESFIEYWIERKYDGGCHTVPAGVELKRIGDEWKVTSLNPIY